jgi:dephospho-CoA kinase
MAAAMILRAGLTGGIASGKSTIARIFATLGCITIDADQIVARLYQPGEAGHAALVQTYGNSILLEDSTIDRRKLSDIAFSSAESARALNALIHPIVIAEERRMVDTLRRTEAGDRIVIVEATLLIEAGGRGRYDRIVVVDVDPDRQLARAIARGMTPDDAARRIANQLSREERLRYADYVIDNNGDERAAIAETRRVFEALQNDLLTRRSN